MLDVKKLQEIVDRATVMYRLEQLGQIEGSWRAGIEKKIEDWCKSV